MNVDEATGTQRDQCYNKGMLQGMRGGGGTSKTWT